MSDNVDKALNSDEYLKNSILNFVDAFYKENSKYPTVEDVYVSTKMMGHNPYRVEHLMANLHLGGWLEVVDLYSLPYRYRTTKIEKENASTTTKD